MLQILTGTDFPFMKYRRVAYFVSGAIVLATLAFLLVKGPRLSVDFTGGTLLQLRTTPTASADAIRSALDGAGFKGAEIQQMTGEAKDEVLVRIRGDAANAKTISEQVSGAISTRIAGTVVEMRRIENVGPKVGGEPQGRPSGPSSAASARFCFTSGSAMSLSSPSAASWPSCTTYS